MKSNSEVNVDDNSKLPNRPLAGQEDENTGERLAPDGTTEAERQERNGIVGDQQEGMNDENTIPDGVEEKEDKKKK